MLSTGSGSGVAGLGRLSQPCWAAIVELASLSTELPERTLLERGVEIAQTATSSRIAYLHYLNEDRRSIELGVWSAATRGYCTAVYDRHYPIDRAGIWADAARTGKPCIHNDYATAPARRGLPDGHSSLIRHAGVPVLEEGIVRMLLGVGNKPVEYDDGDVAALAFIGQRIWTLVGQRRTLERLLDTQRRLLHVQEMAAVCAWEYDVSEDRLQVDTMFTKLFHCPQAEHAPIDLHTLLERVEPGDRDRLRTLMTDGQGGTQDAARVTCRRPDGRPFTADVRVEFRPRALGNGMLGVGIIQDISSQLEVEELRRRVDVDALTGLPNRHRLQEWFDARKAGRGVAPCAFLFIDLDRFKPVNDAFGHAIGDEVLQVVARRLRHGVRKDDLVARVGGDEFVVVLAGAHDIADALAMGDALIASLSDPIVVDGRRIEIGASIGIAPFRDDDIRLEDVAVAADRALYRAKAAGGHRCLVADDIAGERPGASRAAPGRGQPD